MDCLKKYISLLHEHTERNVIVYYSGWLSVNVGLPMEINDLDMNGFMAMTCGLDFDKGLDLILHTPGGNVAATESIINYLYQMFDGDVNAVIPQLAMSGGTMIACSCKKIFMGKQSSLGPIDPQFGNLPAQGLIAEFERARDEINQNPNAIPLWQPIISQYSPTLLNSCQNAIDWANDIVRTSLKRNMFSNEDADDIIEEIMGVIGSHKTTKAHDRHLSVNKCKEIGLKIIDLESDDVLQDYVLSIHHACMEIFEKTFTYKIFCNQNVDLTYNYQI